MARSLTLANLNKINQISIARSGPRYTPGVDSSAPNLQIESLINAVEALSNSSGHKTRLKKLSEEFQSGWHKMSTNLKSAFDEKNARAELCSTLLARLNLSRPSCSQRLIKMIIDMTGRVGGVADNYINDLYKKSDAERDNRESQDAIQRLVNEAHTFQSLLSNLRNFIHSPEFSLRSKNVLLLRGAWGTGKTHTLCDIVVNRMRQKEPTLFLLAQSFPANVPPYHAIGSLTNLAATAGQVFAKLDLMGKASNQRALLIIDGINEGDRKTWQKYLPNLVERASRYKNLGLIISCRTPFDQQIISKKTNKLLVPITHTGFEDVEFDAQREFFRHYEIPEPSIPLLAAEFSRPLFLKIMCQSIAALSRSGKARRVRSFASGQKGMTKLLEDFVVEIGRSIEVDFTLPDKTCWRFLKGRGEGKAAVGLAPTMAKIGADYLLKSFCIDLLKEFCSFTTKKKSEALLSRMVADGLLSEDGIYRDNRWVEVIRLPYQRFSDHLIGRHLLARFLSTNSAESIRRSFYKTKPLGRLFTTDVSHIGYAHPGLASALMLEFPERVKRVLPEDERELFYYLPKKTRTYAQLPAFIEGLLWREGSAFCKQSFEIISRILSFNKPHLRNEMLEAIVCLASRSDHPMNVQRLSVYLARMKMDERDLFWSEFLRSRPRSSAVHKILDWVIFKSDQGKIDEETSRNLICLVSLFLTTTVRTLRDRATKVLVLLGEVAPEALIDATKKAFDFNDPYVLERLLAACYGVLMRRWAVDSARLVSATALLAVELRRRLIGSKREAPIEHILMRDYAEGILKLMVQMDPSKKTQLSLNVTVSGKSNIPHGDKISARSVGSASDAIRMDFDNYTTGRLVRDRGNYDYSHKDYRRVQKQIRWRILNLGYDPQKFKESDSGVDRSNYRLGRSDSGEKIDRYGKKYSWISFYEVAGRRLIRGELKSEYPRISDTDIDPSFPEKAHSWRPYLPYRFSRQFKNAAYWMKKGFSPDYSSLLHLKAVDGVAGPWTLLGGYISECALNDARETFTFLRGMLIHSEDEIRLSRKLQDVDYPGNRAIPDPAEDHYLFAGEIGASHKYGLELRSKRGVAKPHMERVFESYEHRTVKKRYGDLTPAEKMTHDFHYTLGFMKTEARVTDRPHADALIDVHENIRKPGISVELPLRCFAWESYHSEENKAGHPYHPAPTLVDFLHLRKIGGNSDMFDVSGRHASMYREFDLGSDKTRGWLLYIRQDLLELYLAKVHKKIVWINWGERSLHYNRLNGLIDDPRMRKIWDKHDHIHKVFIPCI